jgi:hypothetical protein
LNTLGDEADVESPRVRPHQIQQILSGNAVRKSRVIIGAGDFQGAAAPIVHYDRAQVKPRKIDGGGQSGRTTADDQTVNPLRHQPALGQIRG